jgi:hypothetical protein
MYYLNFEVQVTISSSKSLSRKQLAFEIKKSSHEIVPYTTYRNTKPPKGETEVPKYIIGPQSLKYSECVRKGKPYYDISLSNP